MVYQYSTSWWTTELVDSGRKTKIPVVLLKRVLRESCCVGGCALDSFRPQSSCGSIGVKLPTCYPETDSPQRSILSLRQASPWAGFMSGIRSYIPSRANLASTRVYLSSPDQLAAGFRAQLRRRAGWDRRLVNAQGHYLYALSD